MRVTLLLFAVLRERAGAPSLDLDLPEGATIAQAIDRAIARAPGLAPLGNGLRTARNREFAPSTEVLFEGDELALLPPVSGG